MPTLSSITEKVVFPKRAIKITVYLFFLITMGSLILLTIKEYNNEIIAHIENYCIIILFIFFSVGLIGIFYVTYNLIKKTI